MSRQKAYTNIDLSGMHPSGRCIGYAGTMRVYADYGIPGETVDISGVRREGDYRVGIVSGIKEPSADRTDPFCKHFGLCGGCNWQHITYARQLELKRRILSDALEKYAIITPEIPLPVSSPSLTHYRHRVEYNFSSRRWYYEGEGKVDDPAKRLAVGFHPADNPGKTIDIEECYLQDEPGRKIVSTFRDFALSLGLSFYDPKEKTGFLRSMAIRITTTGQVMVIITFGEENEDLIRQVMQFLAAANPEINSLWHAVVPAIADTYFTVEPVLWQGSSPVIREIANGLHFTMGPHSFYQPNPRQAERIFKRIRELALTGGSGLVYDLYSGIGTLALSVAHTAGKVTGIEGSPQAVGDAMANALLNGFPHAEFIAGDVLRTFTPEWVDRHGKPSVIMLDPPRAGTLIEIKKTILYAAPEKIIYLSCNPLSLANDLRMLTSGYRVSLIEPYDQSPHTAHLETLVFLEKEN